MSTEAMTEQDIDEIAGKTLSVLGVSASEYEAVSTTLLRAEPVWPGRQWSPASPGELAAFIDHTALKADLPDEEIWRLCLEARALKFASVCVNSCHVSRCVAELAGTGVTVCSVVGFPLGAMAMEAKRAEAEYVVDSGAGEVDMVINIGKLKTGTPDSLNYVFEDIRAVVDGAWGSPVKVILETALLNEREIVAACVVAVVAGAAFVKTSTGFSTGGATLQHVGLMRRVVGPNIGVKASGGVRTYEATLSMIQAGANRIGTSSGVAIVKGDSSNSAY